MPRYYKVRLPKRIATHATRSKPAPAAPAFDDFEGDPGVTFRVEDLASGKIPTESTVEMGGARDSEVGLTDAEAAELLASMAVAERASQPDRLPIVVALVVAALFVVMASGVVQKLVDRTRDQMIEDRIKRPRAQHGWTGRVGATREALGLPEKPVKPAEYEALPTRFFPSLR